MISIITACYNCEKTIHKAIESLLNQTSRAFEHIVIDGASKDGTLAVIEKYRPQYEKLGISLRVLSEPDEGLYDALNKGIKLAQGDYVGILNADDLYPQHTIEVVERTRMDHPEADVLMGSSETVNGDKVSLKKAGNSRLLTSRDFNHGAMFVSKTCYDDIGYYMVSKNIYADFAWYIRARKCNKQFYLLPENLYVFICGGMSTGKSFRDVKKRIVDRYEAYTVNYCSKLYIIECIAMELAKWVMLQ